MQHLTLEKGYRNIVGHGGGVGADDECQGLGRSTSPFTTKCGTRRIPRPGQRQSPVAYQTVNTVQCVQVPVTQYQTQYRTEYRTENVPVTRMVSETVNETRTITRFIPQQETINKQVITHYVCEPVTEIKKCYRPVPVTKNVQKTLYQTYCTTEIVTKEITNFVPECVTETVPVTKMHKVVQDELTYVTQKVPVTSMVPVVTLCTYVWPQMRRRRLRRLRRSDHVRSVQAGDDLCLPGCARHASDGEVRPRDDLRSAYPDEDDAGQADGAVSSDQGEPDSLPGHPVHHRHRIPVL